jgi:hypothetical protein
LYWGSVANPLPEIQSIDAQEGLQQSSIVVVIYGSLPMDVLLQNLESDMA